MKALFWKDVRLNRPALVLGGVLVSLPYGGALALGLFSSAPADSTWLNYDTVMMAGFVSLVLSLLTLTILAGNALAAEREDRSAEFLACLPPSRWNVIASKLILIAAVFLPVIGVSVITIFGVAPRMPGAPAELVPSVHDNPAIEFLYVLVGATLLFGVAWFCSSVVRRGSTAIAAALLTPPALMGVLLIVLNVLDIPATWLGPTFRVAALVMGLTGFVAGTLHFVNRFEP